MHIADRREPDIDDAGWMSWDQAVELEAILQGEHVSRISSLVKT
jgi:hypothetical protein